jgi:hypothetical protein
MTFICTLLLAAALSNNPQAPEQKAEEFTVDQLYEFDSHSCTPARVRWLDASLQTRATSVSTDITAADIDASIPEFSSWGCVNKTLLAVVVIHSFVDGAPDDYLIVPKSWVVEITPLQLTPAPAPVAEPDKTGIQLSQR